MADVKGLIRDPRFKMLTPEQQKAAIAQVEPRIGQLNDEQFQTFVSSVAGPATAPTTAGTGRTGERLKGPLRPKGIIKQMDEAEKQIEQGYGKLGMGVDPTIGGASDIFRGSVGMAYPYLLALGATSVPAALKAASGIVTGGITGTLAQHGSRAMGVPEGTSQALGDVTGLFGGYLGSTKLPGMLNFRAAAPWIAKIPGLPPQIKLALKAYSYAAGKSVPGGPAGAVSPAEQRLNAAQGYDPSGAVVHGELPRPGGWAGGLGVGPTEGNNPPPAWLRNLRNFTFQDMERKQRAQSQKGGPPPATQYYDAQGRPTEFTSTTPAEPHPYSPPAPFGTPEQSRQFRETYPDLPAPAPRPAMGPPRAFPPPPEPVPDPNAPYSTETSSIVRDLIRQGFTPERAQWMAEGLARDRAAAPAGPETKRVGGFGATGVGGRAPVGPPKTTLSPEDLPVIIDPDPLRPVPPEPQGPAPVGTKRTGGFGGSAVGRQDVTPVTTTEPPVGNEVPSVSEVQGRPAAPGMPVPPVDETLGAPREPAEPGAYSPPPTFGSKEFIEQWVLDHPDLPLPSMTAESIQQAAAARTAARLAAERAAAETNAMENPPGLARQAPLLQAKEPAPGAPTVAGPAAFPARAPGLPAPPGLDTGPEPPEAPITPPTPPVPPTGPAPIAPAPEGLEPGDEAYWRAMGDVTAQKAYLNKRFHALARQYDMPGSPVGKTMKATPIAQALHGVDWMDLTPDQMDSITRFMMENKRPPTAADMASGLYKDPTNPMQNPPDVEPATGATTVETPKEPWQMTRAEYIKSRVSPEGAAKTSNKSFTRNTSLADEYKQKAAMGHRNRVAAAIQEGKDVPPEVLADYPDLAQLAKNPMQNPPMAGAVMPGPVDVPGAPVSGAGPQDFAARAPGLPPPPEIIPEPKQAPRGTRTAVEAPQPVPPPVSEPEPVKPPDELKSNAPRVEEEPVEAHPLDKSANEVYGAPYANLNSAQQVSLKNFAAKNNGNGPTIEDVQSGAFKRRGQTMPNPPELQVPTAAEYSSDIEAKLQESIDRVNERMAKRHGGTLLSNFPAGDVGDMAIWGAAKLAKGAVSFGKWSKEMLADAGDSAEDVKPLLKDMYAKSQKIVEKVITQTAGNLPSTRKLLQMYAEGKSGQDWYLQTRAELERVFGEKDAGLFLDFLAVTSPNNTVAGNVTLALKAYMQHKTGQPFTGYMPSVIGNLNRIVAEGGMRGQKVNPFKLNLMGDPIPVTVDRWIHRAYGFPGKAPTAAQFKYMDYSISQLAKERGVEPRQMQAAIWKTIKEAQGKAGNTSQSFDEVLKERLDADPELVAAIQRARQMSAGPVGPM